MGFFQKKNIRWVLVAFGVVAGLFFAEGALRIYQSPEGGPGNRAPENKAYMASPWAWPHEGAGVHMHAMTRPFTREDQAAEDLNALGFRGPGHTIARPANTFRILVLGDSVTWGQGVLFEEAFGARLLALFKKKGLAKGCQVEVISMGVRGSRFVDNMLRLMVCGQYLEPDLVVFQFLANDLETAPGRGDLRFFGGFLPEEPPENGPLALLAKNTRLGALFYKGGRKIALETAFTQKRKAAYDPGSWDWKFFLELVNGLFKWRKTTNTPVLFVVFPDFDMNRMGSNFRGFKNIPPHSRLVEKAIQAMEQKGFPVLYLQDAYKKTAGARFLCLSESDAHPNALAHEIAAEALFAYLVSENSVDCDKREDLNQGAKYKEERELLAQAEKNRLLLGKDPRKRQAFFSELKRLYPDNPWVAALLADSFRAAGDQEKAGEAFGGLTPMAPEYAAPWFHMGGKTSSVSDKERLYLKMTKKVPGHAFSWQRLADLYEKQGRKKDACACLEKVVSTYMQPDQLVDALKDMDRLECPNP